MGHQIRGSVVKRKSILYQLVKRVLRRMTRAIAVSKRCNPAEETVRQIEEYREDPDGYWKAHEFGTDRIPPRPIIPKDKA